MPLKSAALATSSVLRTAMVSRARAPTSYQLFCAAERKAGRLPKGLGDQSKALAAKWNALDEKARNPYEVQARAATATESTASGFAAGSISIKSESALDKASKKLSEAAVKGLLEGLTADGGKTVSLKGVGQLKATARDDGKFEIIFKPSKASLE